jgi:hypothetical protein
MGILSSEGMPMRFFRQPWLALFATLQAGCAAPAPPAPLEAADLVFGIRLGQPLLSQCAACVLDGDRALRAPDVPCWRTDPVYKGARSVLLPESLMVETGRIDIRRVREVGGVVVEVEAQFAPADAKRVERHLRRRKGPPTESEAYERDSRVFGTSSFMSHSWRGQGATLHFSERAPGDVGQVLAFVDRWAGQHAREEQAWRDRDAARR